MTNTPRSCSQCLGKLKAKMIFEKFTHDVNYGHAKCGKCGITFDSNVNEMADTVVTSAEDLKKLNETEYRELFVETSEIADEDGDIYTDFKWDDNDSVKVGVAEHVIRALDARHKDGIKRFADVGCGSGFMSREIAKKYPGSTVHAIDPSPLVQRLAGVQGVQPHQGTLQTAGLEADSVEALSIIGNWMLHMDPMDTLKEAHRVLQPGGTLIIDFKNVKSATRIMAGWALRMGLDRFGGRGLLERNFLNMRYGFTKKYVLRSLDEQGFKAIEIESKPPRLLEFSNKSHYQTGVKGLVWRSLDGFDAMRKEQAWIQIVAEKK